MSIEYTAQVTCNECTKNEFVEITEYYEDTVGVDENDLPEGWIEQDCGVHLCSECVKKVERGDGNE